MRRPVTALLIICSAAILLQSASAYDITYPYGSLTDHFRYSSGRGGGTTIIIITDGCGEAGWGYGTLRGGRVFRDMRDRVYSPETRFTVRAGEEFLIYESNILLYTDGERRSTVMVYPEELWTIMEHCRRPVAAATGQVSIEVWYPGLESPVNTFLTVHDPAMSVVQVLLQRGREMAALQ